MQGAARCEVIVACSIRLKIGGVGTGDGILQSCAVGVAGDNAVGQNDVRRRIGSGAEIGNVRRYIFSGNGKAVGISRHGFLTAGEKDVVQTVHAAKFIQDAGVALKNWPSHTSSCPPAGVATAASAYRNQTFVSAKLSACDKSKSGTPVK